MSYRNPDAESVADRARTEREREEEEQQFVESIKDHKFLQSFLEKFGQNFGPIFRRVFRVLAVFCAPLIGFGFGKVIGILFFGPDTREFLDLPDLLGILGGVCGAGFTIVVCIIWLILWLTKMRT